ncbi:hypothetical protein C9374_012244 [Naegleria lovaniensis]|uniref:DUF4116 domain-containing protein n=1 Tax=Naegleria lovaniensis TaxID=51637 RepID=A0AA88GEG9_NAELO|nr:uncharacterized protein C9374_012244 [Naegleria lovaniensis]KAG2373378.1 hypothetical protein C9374_012244 [Naegleria lovaniensis]
MHRFHSTPLSSHNHNHNTSGTYVNPPISDFAFEIEQRLRHQEQEQIHPFRSGQVIPFQSLNYEFRVESLEELLREGEKIINPILRMNLFDRPQMTSGISYTNPTLTNTHVIHNQASSLTNFSNRTNLCYPSNMTPNNTTIDTSHRIPVQLILHDFDKINPSLHPLSQLDKKLNLKFQNQIRGFVKWFSRREEHIRKLPTSTPSSSAMIPIEFLNDRAVVENFIEIASRANISLQEMKFPHWICRPIDPHFIPHELQHDKNFFLKAIDLNQGVSIWKIVPSKLKSDPDMRDGMVKKLISNGESLALEFASSNLKDDTHWVMEALKRGCGSCLQFASDRLKDSLPHVLQSLPRGLVFANARFRQDPSLALEIVRKNGLCLEFMSNELKSNREVVMDAISQNGNALKFASEELRDDTKIVDLALDYDLECIRFASQNVLSCKSYMMDVISENGFLLEYASDNLKADEQIIEKAFLQEPQSIEFASIEFLMENKHFLLNILKQDVKNRALDTLMLNHEFKSIFRDKEFIMEWLKVRGDIFKNKHFPRALYRNDKDVALTALISNRENVDYIDTILLQDENFINECVKHGVFCTNFLQSHIDNALSRFEQWKQARLEAEYFGCDIPSHFTISKPLPMLNTVHKWIFNKKSSTLDEFDRWL